MGRWLLYRAAKHRAEMLALYANGADLALIWKMATNPDDSYARRFSKELIDEYEAYRKEGN